jgi:hypothetical protein
MIKINGKTYFGNNIQVINNKVIIDGKDVTSEHADSKEISIVVEGNLDSLEVVQKQLKSAVMLILYQVRPVM